MSAITIDVQGVQGVQAALAAFGAKAEAGIAKAITATALDINTDVKKRIQRGPKTGVVYRRGGGQNLSSEHQASAPGEAPATDTGTLVSSVYFEQSSKLSATVGSRLAYSAYLEFGTMHILPRPSWVPATEAATPKLITRIEAALRKAAQ